MLRTCGLGLIPLVAAGVVAAGEATREPADRAAKAAEPGWLGVQIGPVPRALAAHLSLDGPAIMVRNVAKDSPADRAGIAQYDVIVKLDGMAAPGDVPGFTELLRSKEAGSEITITLMRRASEREVRVKLAGAPRGGRIEYKYPDDRDELLRQSFNVRGKILRPGPHGGYILEDLGEWPEWEAYLFGKPSPPPSGVLPERLRQWGESMRKYRQEMDRLSKEYRDLAKRFEEQRRKSEADRVGEGVERPARDPAKSVSFAVDAAGRVTVTVRRDRSEIRMEFENEEQFEKKAPELFRQYKEMRDRAP